MRKNAWWTFGFIAIITIVAGLMVWPDDVWIFKGIRIHPGLDLKGGTQLVYELATAELGGDDRTQAIEGVREAMARRVDAFGVAEPVIQSTRVGETDAVIVELPGIADVSAAKALIGKTAELEFWQPGEVGTEGGRETFVGTFVPTDLGGADLKRASVVFDQGPGGTGVGSPVVQLEFNDDGKEKFKRLTQDHIGQSIAVFLDDALITAPTVQTAITNGVAIITGDFSVSEAKELSIQLNAGALPIPVTLVEERTIGATLGTESVQTSLVAGIVGLLLVGFFMTAYYRLAGLMATVALAIYSILTLAIFELVPVTLTLAGIAGFILSIGMAVDANILIFERMREETRAGKPMNLAIEEGFRRAWPSIIDSNISSLITAAILYYATTGLVRGFAVTLAIGILVSMFSAITVTRTFLRLTLRERRGV